MSEPISKPQRHWSFEGMASLGAILVGVAALYLSWDQGRLMREEIRASVWPALQLHGFVNTKEKQLAVGFRIENAGVGPALVEQVRVFYRDELIRDIQQLSARFPDDSKRSFEKLNGRIIAAGAEVKPFEFRYEVTADQDVIAVLNELANDWAGEVCYCSSLKQCWISDLSTSPPHEVAACDASAVSDI